MSKLLPPGAAIFDGKIFRTTLYANVIALDAQTGKELWRKNAIDFKNGYSDGGAAGRRRGADHRDFRWRVAAREAARYGVRAAFSENTTSGPIRPLQD